MIFCRGCDSNDPASLRVHIPNYMNHSKQHIKGLKIGIPKYYLENLDADVEKLFIQAVGELQYLGADIKELFIPELEMSTFAGYATVGGEAAAFHYEWLKTDAEDYSLDIRSFFLAGALTYARQYVQAQQMRRKMIQAFDKAFQEVDMLLGPTIPIRTPKFQENWVWQNLDVVKRIMPFTVPINLTGVPPLSVPIGLDSNGLPVGMQLIGNHLTEKKLLQAGSVWENTNPLLFKINRD